MLFCIQSNGAGDERRDCIMNTNIPNCMYQEILKQMDDK